MTLSVSRIGASVLILRMKAINDRLGARTINHNNATPRSNNERKIVAMHFMSGFPNHRLRICKLLPCRAEVEVSVIRRLFGYADGNHPAALYPKFLSGLIWVLDNHPPILEPNRSGKHSVSTHIDNIALIGSSQRWKTRVTVTTL